MGFIRTMRLANYFPLQKANTKDALYWRVHLTRFYVQLIGQSKRQQLQHAVTQPDADAGIGGAGTRYRI